MRLYLLRHGQTDWNVIRRLQGSVDTPLNPTGVRQAQGWRAYFDDIRLAGVYSSSLERAVHTAVLATGRPSCIMPTFDERSFGVWEGTTWEELRSTVPDFEIHWNDDLFLPPGGESRAALYGRVRSGLEATLSTHSDSDEILIVGHGASGHAILANLLNRSIAERASLPALHNGSLIVLESVSNRWMLMDVTAAAEA